MHTLTVKGHVDAGKSTLMGHLLYLLGNVNKRTMHKYEQEAKKAGKASFAYAWVLDETGEERDRSFSQTHTSRLQSRAKGSSFVMVLFCFCLVCEVSSKDDA